MSETLKFCFSVIFSVLCITAVSQDSESLEKPLTRYFHLGPLLSIPVYDYADTDPENDDAGFANTGFGISFGYKEFLDQSPGYLHIGFDAIYQSTTLFTEAADYIESTGLYDVSKVKNPTYVSFPLKTGLGLGTRKENNNFYIEALVGFTLTKMFEGSMNLKQVVPIPGGGQGTAKSETKWGQTITYGGEIGYMPNDHFALSVEFVQVHEAALDYKLRGILSGSKWTMYQQMFNIKAQLVLGKR